MQSKVPGNVQEILKKFTDSAVRIFGQELTGVYLHGSLALGCFNPVKSDIDLIVVVEGGVTDGQKMRFMEDVVEMNRAAPEKGIEMSVVRRADCREFVYPTPYELHFSPAHLDWFLREPQEYIRRMKGTDKDLAAHFTMISHCGIVLEGAGIGEVFGRVPREDFVDSIWHDIENAGEDIAENPVYVILNLCRVLAFLEEDSVLSKLQGGEWGAEKLPVLYHAMIRRAVQCYTLSDGSGWKPCKAEADAFCSYMLERIRGRICS